MTGEVTSMTYHKYHVITIVKYDDYQGNDKQNDKQVTNERQTDDKRMTTSIENIESIERVERVEDRERGVTARRFTPPTREEIEGFLLENGLEIDVDRFMNY